MSLNLIPKTKYQKNKKAVASLAWRFNKTKQNKGSALLIAILMSAVVLAVGFGVYQRTYKEVLFSSLWRQTQVAFSAADAGLECAVYRDLHPASTSCFGTPFTWGPIVLNVPWSVDRPVGTGCVNIKITKGGTTTIEARGYNNCNALDSRRVERGLRITY